MTNQDQVTYWLNLAEQDLEVAESNYNHGYYLWCLFISHLVIEKALKALFIQNRDEVPPKIHDLVKIAKSSHIEISESDLRFLNELTRFNISGRYPEYKDNMNSIATKEFTLNKLDKTKELFKWLKSLKK